jgi:hypothetical protein
MTGNPVVLVNRTSRILEFVADGQQHQLMPGENFGFNSAQARFAKSQNTLKGSEDYHTMRSTSLVGIKDKDDCSEIGDEVLNAASTERFDRATMPGAEKFVLVPVRHRVLGRIAGIAGGESQAIGG